MFIIPHIIKLSNVSLSLLWAIGGTIVVKLLLLNHWFGPLVS